MKKYLFLVLLGVMILTSCTITVDVSSWEELQYYDKDNQEIDVGQYKYYQPYTLKSESYLELDLDIENYSYDNQYYLEVMFMTEENFYRFKNHEDYNAYHKNITNNLDNFWRIENIPAGKYFLVVDYSSRGEIEPPFWYWKTYEYDFTLKINKMY